MSCEQKFRMELHQDSCICGYHFYDEIWTAVFGGSFNNWERMKKHSGAWNIPRVTFFYSDTWSSRFLTWQLIMVHLNTADFNTAMYYLLRLLIPLNKNLLYGMCVRYFHVYVHVHILYVSVYICIMVYMHLWIELSSSWQYNSLGTSISTKETVRKW